MVPASWSITGSVWSCSLRPQSLRPAFLVLWTTASSVTAASSATGTSVWQILVLDWDPVPHVWLHGPKADQGCHKGHGVVLQFWFSVAVPGPLMASHVASTTGTSVWQTRVLI